MSGIEAVGLVLGIIPLIISALEHYQEGKSAVSTWRRHVRIVRSLVRNLKIEQGNLYNTCELLLSGIIPPVNLNPMLDEPFGPLWQDKRIKKRIEERLNRSYNVFEETVGEMLAIMKELESNLEFKPEGQPEQYMSGAVERNMKRASLVINRSSYDAALQGLTLKNQTLATIVSDSLKLEPFRRQRSRGKYLGLLRKILSSIYKALQLGLHGTCPQKHGMNLQLLDPGLSLRGDEESIIGKLDFRVILLHNIVDLASPLPQSWIWKEVKLQVDVSSGNHRARFILSRRPQIEEMAIRDRPSEVNNSIPAATSPPKLVTGKLCQALSIDNFGMTCGYVTDPSVDEYGQFGVSRIDDIRDSCELTFVSIRDIMATPVRWRRGTTPSPTEKLGLASTIASGILQLQTTPWLSVVMTSDTLYLARFDSVVKFDRVYISKTASEDLCHHSPICHGPCEIIRAEGFDSELIWGLFVLLIEVIFWRAIDDILSERFALNVAGTSPSDIFDCGTGPGFKILPDLLSHVALVGGQEYRNAVQNCLKLAFDNSIDLGQDAIRQQIYNNIITPIEESCESSNEVIVVTGGVEITF
ncbi:hypothetical protein O1611_g4471 [Lasiodiplodia mahajangana]|uniref:Uncharacterized protein n=1 Tax=Lasiodiplodia mahajangana TaxID=1108764 RepID=A0ACC2JNW4_9PEZI|nr:hypothetical protein O1611_g4471 [Lasiodiplodia mahajangana]